MINNLLCVCGFNLVLLTVDQKIRLYDLYKNGNMQNSSWKAYLLLQLFLSSGLSFHKCAILLISEAIIISIYVLEELMPCLPDLPAWFTHWSDSLCRLLAQVRKNILYFWLEWTHSLNTAGNAVWPEDFIPWNNLQSLCSCITLQKSKTDAMINIPRCLFLK